MTSRELFDAVWDDDDTARVQEILRRSSGTTIDVNEQFDNAMAPLHVAVRNDNLPTVNVLLAAGAQVGIKDLGGRTPLHFGCYHKVSMEIVQVLHNAGANLNERDDHGRTPLFDACHAGYWQIIEPLAKLGACLAEVDDDGDSLLHEAAAGLQKEMPKTIEILLKNGADIGARNKWGETPLHNASVHGIIESVALLLDRGADSATRDKRGLGPLHIACRNAHPEVVKLLVKNGAEVDATADDEATPLFQTVATTDRMEERLEIIRFLFKEGAAWNSMRNDGSTPFHTACCGGNVDVVRIFLDQGLDIEAKDRDGDSPLVNACYNMNGENLEVVQELVSRGADWSYKSPDTGMTPFDAACDNGYDRIREYLQQRYQQDLDNLAQIEGRSPLHVILQQAKYTEEIVEEEEAGEDGERTVLTTTKKVSIRLGSVAIDAFLSILASIISGDPNAIRSQDEDRSLPLHIACRARAHVEVIRYLTSEDAVTLHYTDNTGSLPIHAACGAGSSLENIQHLVEVGGGAVTLCARDHECALPLHSLCKAKPSVDVVQFMIRSYSKAVSARTESGDLPIMLAIQHQASEDVIFELLKANPGALIYMKEYFAI